MRCQKRNAGKITLGRTRPQGLRLDVRPVNLQQSEDHGGNETESQKRRCSCKAVRYSRHAVPHCHSLNERVQTKRLMIKKIRCCNAI